MSLIRPIQPPPTPVIVQPKTVADYKTLITGDINRLFMQVIQTYRKNMDRVWNNQTNLTPQQIFDQFGKDGVELLRLAGILKTMANAAVPGSIPDDPNVPNITVNPDGSVTITQ